MKQVNPNSRTLNYSTGRTYDAPQVLEIELLNLTEDEYGTFTGSALFVDRSRHIAARVDIFTISESDADIGRAVLAAYDSGEYYSKLFAHLAFD
jgi:hypothetical protein